MKNYSLIVATASALTLAVAASADVYNFRTVAMTGDAAPGSFNGVFTEFGVPSINSAGQVAFAAKTNASGVTSGMWMTPPNAPDTVSFIAGKGWPFPGAPNGVVFGDFLMGTTRAPLINDLGNVGFAASLQGLGNDDVTGLFRRINGTTSKVFIPGDAAPGMNPGVTFKQLGASPTFNNNNLMAFNAYVEGPGIDAPFHSTQYMHWFGGLSLVTQEGSPAPGLPGLTMGYTFSFRTQINDSGRIAFLCVLEDGGNSSQWSGWPGAMSAIQVSGHASPLNWPFSGTGSNIGGSLTEDGMVFPGYVWDGTSSRMGLWHYNGQTITTVAVNGSNGPLGTYASIYQDSMMAAGNGTTVFRAKFNLAENADTAVVRKSPGQAPTLIVRENDPVYPWGTIQFDDLGSQDKLILDDAGRTYFIAKVRGPGVNAGNDLGMWVREADGEWHMVIRRGQYMALEDGVYRTVDTFAVLPGYGMHTGYRPGVNNNGDVAIRINFTDGTSAIVVAELPKCVGDLNNDGVVNVSDLLILLAAWGNCNSCDADLNNDNVVNVSDLLILLAAWGPCP